MKNIPAIYIIVFLACRNIGCFATSLSDTSLPVAPEMTSSVVDTADLLKFPRQLSDKLETIFESGGPQIAILTLKNLDGKPIESWSLAAARQWQLGRAIHRDGLLIVVAKAERKVRVEVGTGLEDKVTPPIARDLIHQFMLPQFRIGKFQKGIEGAIYRALEETSRPPTWNGSVPKSWQLTPRKKAWKSGEPIFVGFFFLILLLGIFRGSTRQTRGRRYTGADVLDGRREYWSSKRNKPSSSSADSFGDRFGGGGASGSW